MPSGSLALLRYCQGRLLGLRTTRYSWWAHWRELADYLLPRRYRWLITANINRGSPINQHILDSTGTLAARNLASGMVSGISSPTRPWYRLKVGRIDSTQTSAISLWLAECERLMQLVFQAANFYQAIAVFYYDLVVFGTAALIIYEDFEKVIRCVNPALGEYYVDNDGQLRPVIFYREFTYTVGQTVSEFGKDNCSPSVQADYDRRDGSGRTREVIIAHGIEPNTDPSKTGVPAKFKYYEVYWEQGNTTGTQNGPEATKFLRKRGFYEQAAIVVRWDVTANDAYGRSPGMDALPDVKQLQLEVKRKAQGIDKHVNPPMLADIQLKNQPASVLPGGMTYVSGMLQAGKPGMAPAYGNWKPELAAITEDLKEVKDRIRRIFFNDLFQTASQFETRSNITAIEWDMRKSESMVMLGPVLDRIHYEGLDPIIDRVFGIMSRAGIFPDPPAEIAGKPIDIEYISMLSLAQQAASTAGIERMLQIAGNLAGIDPATMDNIDIDFTIDKYASLMNLDPRMIRSPEELQQIRQQRAEQQAQQQQLEAAEKLAAGAKTLSETQLGGGQNALEMMVGGGAV